ncbi:MAG: hypothetical protein FJZ90_02745 [Chloroflexi bacterium]|nr:hypothetical protein [Chloroflexota bacterium]
MSQPTSPHPPTATPTRSPTFTPEPTPTALPTAPPTASASDWPEGSRVWEALQLEQERGGVIVRLRALALVPLDALVGALGEEGAAELLAVAGQDVQAVGVLNVQVENATEAIAHIHPDEAVVIADDERVATYPTLSDPLGGGYAPGAQREGLVLFGLRRGGAPQIRLLRYVVSPPYGEDGHPLSPEGYDLALALQ